MQYRAMYKSELAIAANVSRSTLARWIRNEQEALNRLHVSPHAHRLPAKAVELLDKRYCIF